MQTKPQSWKKGRGKLGVFQPLLGRWSARADSPLGPIGCTRVFAPELKGKYVRLDASWDMGEGVYQEMALFGTNAEGDVAFWSFTSDGKQSAGRLTDGTDLHPEALAFEAQMPAGIARQVYWPDEAEGFHWVVESKTKKGWNRFVHHHYHPA